MILLALSIIWLLVVAGLLARAIGQYRHFRVLQAAPADPGGAPLPSVTVIVPARNEERVIGRCLAGVVGQDYPREAMRGVVVDDNSEDRTGTIIAEAARADARIEVIAGGPLPAGWLGKPHACAEAAARATGDWLCFIDADTVAEPPAIRTAMRVALADGLDLLSLQPQQELRSVAERLIVPAGFFLLAFTQDLRRTNDPASPEASVDGQFLLIRRAVYEAIGGHAAVRNAVAEDSELAKRVKAAGPRLALYGTQGLLQARMYDDVRSLRQGLARQAATLLGGAPALLIAAVCATAVACAAVLLPAWAGYDVASRGGGVAIASLCCAAAGSLAMLGTHVGAARYFRMPIGYGLVYPLQYLLGAALLAYAAWQQARGRTRWKGRLYEPAGDAGPGRPAALRGNADGAPIP
ncbi:MAG TPA: glycosyltransferase [Tepidisphaeraceae bacterium]|jgi:chlorobactene glucosyltransferase